MWLALVTKITVMHSMFNSIRCPCMTGLKFGHYIVHYAVNYYYYYYYLLFYIIYRAP